jgi:acetylornithine deacetylase/succinyl-diaminopimelate desuccinylase-like protein
MQAKFLKSALSSVNLNNVMISLAELKKWYQQRAPEILSDYFSFLRIASISADPSRKLDCIRAANFLCQYMKKGGLNAETIETKGLPLVYAEDLSAGPSAPTLLIYGHYDVQPVDPLDLWESLPFEPTLREGQIYARGAVDDKGQIFYAILAAICWKSLGILWNINVKFCIEGEEESQSLGLRLALPHLKDKLKADYLLIVDFDELDKDKPAIALGARGLVGLEVTLTGSRVDLHSGICGGIAYNPNRALVELLSRLWDEEGRVQVPHFYDGVKDASLQELEAYTYLHDANYYKKTFGIHAFGGEKGRSLQERNCLRPTLEINGISGGYTGVGMKTVIPARASAKISCRLVSGQDPQKVGDAVAQFLKDRVVEGMEIHIERQSGSYAFLGDPNSSLARAVAKASQEVTGVSCKNTLSGGSIPIIEEMRQACGAEVVGMGFGLPDDQIHAPNEHFDMHRFEQGFLTVGRTLGLL